ncbi:DDE-type integrase/transposase/recombinase [Bacteriovorax stolpii]|uniref:DDE-type integrase/transposase/recombinase n=1 Tax=Bacteriovorax stolpii TaxID=960 RepID=UPI001FD4A786|nr:DDE-type integrase/transposase/recombinase [Bacteriovorax stolpii]
MEKGRKIKLEDLAKRLGVTKRTLRNWKAKVQKDCSLRSGRPRYTSFDHRRAMILVARELKRQGYPGSSAIAAELKGKVQLRLIRKYVSEIKERRRLRRLAEIKLNQVRVEVKVLNAIWVQDGTYLGRKNKKAIESQIIKDRGSKKIIGVLTGSSATGCEIVYGLELLKKERGLPLVWMTDNGTAYCNKEVKEYVEREKIVHVRSLPRTPQHNGSAEVMMRELKTDCLLGKKTVLDCEIETHASVVSSAIRINKNRRRMSLSFKSSDETDDEMRMNGKKLDRDLFYEEYCQEMKTLVNVQGMREKKMREREIVMCLLEKHEMITRKRSGLEYGR